MEAYKVVLKWVMGIMAALILAGATALGTTVHNGIEKNAKQIDALQEENEELSRQNIRIELQLEQMAEDIRHIRKLLEKDN